MKLDFEMILRKILIFQKKSLNESMELIKNDLKFIRY